MPWIKWCALGILEAILSKTIHRRVRSSLEIKICTWRQSEQISSSDRIQMLPELLRKSSVSRRALSKSIETGSIVDAGRSFCFRIPPGLRRWQLRNFVALGRMLAIQARSKKELVFIGKAAALLHELPVFGSLPHIDFSSGLSTHLVLPGGRAVSEAGIPSSLAVRLLVVTGVDRKLLRS